MLSGTAVVGVVVMVCVFWVVGLVVQGKACADNWEAGGGVVGCRVPIRGHGRLGGGLSVVLCPMVRPAYGLAAGNVGEDQ